MKGEAIIANDSTNRKEESTTTSRAHCPPAQVINSALPPPPFSPVCHGKGREGGEAHTCQPLRAVVASAALQYAAAKRKETRMEETREGNGKTAHVFLLPIHELKRT